MSLAQSRQIWGALDNEVPLNTGELARYMAHTSATTSESQTSAKIARGLQIMSRPAILTQAALAHVASLVDNGRGAAEIASEIGCTLGTLRVRCSQHGISLRRRATGRREAAVTTMDLSALAEANAAARRKSIDRNTIDQCRTFVNESSVEVRAELKVLLPPITTEQLRQRGALRGISDSTLASELLVTIARDGLYDAVLDGG
jgi:hypothetical protein